MDYHKLNLDYYGANIVQHNKKHNFKEDFLTKIDDIISDLNYKKYRNDLITFINNNSDPFLVYMNCNLFVLSYVMYRNVKDDTDNIKIFEEFSKDLTDSYSNVDLIRYYYYIKKNINL